MDSIKCHICSRDAELLLGEPRRINGRPTCKGCWPTRIDEIAAEHATDRVIGIDCPVCGAPLFNVKDSYWKRCWACQTDVMLDTKKT